MKWLLLLCALPCFAGTYLTVTDTNISLPAGVAMWRECIEAEVFTTISTNWIDGAVQTDTNGVRHIPQQQVIFTNVDWKFSYSNEVLMVHRKHFIGPAVGERILQVPPILPPHPIPLRNTNRFRLRTNVVVEPMP